MGTKWSAITSKLIPESADQTLIIDNDDGTNKIIDLDTIPLNGNDTLKGLATGIVKNTTTTGTLSIAAAEIDYATPVTGVYIVGKTAGCATLADAITTIGSTPATLVVPSSVAEAISTDLTIPSTLSVQINKGALMTIGTVALAGTATYADTDPTKTISTYSSTGTPTSGSPIITSVGSTAGLTEGCHIEIQAGFPAGLHKVLSVTSTTITVDTNATSSPGAGQTITSLDGVTFSDAQEANSDIRQYYAGYIQANGERKQLGKFTSSTTAIMRQPFTSALAANAWKYSGTVITCTSTADLLAGDIVTIGAENFLVTKVINATTFDVDHHPESEFTAQPITRYMRLQFNGSVNIGNYQVFSGPAKFGGGIVRDVLPQWYGSSGKYSAVDVDDSASFQMALYCATFMVTTLDVNPINSNFKRVWLPEGNYKITKTIYVTANLAGAGKLVSLLTTTISNGTPTLLYNFIGNTHGTSSSWHEFDNYGITGNTSVKNTVGHLIARTQRSRFSNIFADYCAIGIQSVHNWFNKFDGLNTNFCTYGLNVYGAANGNDYHAVIEGSTYGVDVNGGIANSISNGPNESNFILRIEQTNTNYAFRLGNGKSGTFRIYFESGSSLAQINIGDGTQRISNMYFSIMPTYASVYINKIDDCTFDASTIVASAKWRLGDSIRGGLKFNTIPSVDPASTYRLVDALSQDRFYSNPPENLFVNPFFRGALRGWKATTLNNATISLFANDTNTKFGAGGLKVTMTNATAQNYVDLELPQEVVLKMKDKRPCTSAWIYTPSAMTSTLRPSIQPMWSTDGGVTWTNLISGTTTGPTPYYTLGGWNFSCNSNSVYASYATMTNVTNIKLRFYGNWSANNAVTGDYVVFYGVYFGDVPLDLSSLIKCQWSNAGYGGYEVGSNLVLPQYKYALTGETIAIEKDDKTLTSAGNWITKGVRVGDTITLGGCTTGSNNGDYLISNITATVLTYTTTTGGTTTEAGTGTQTVDLVILGDTLQTYIVGDEWRNSLPVASGVPGGVCTTAGAGGTAVFTNRAALVP